MSSSKTRTRTAKGACGGAGLAAGSGDDPARRDVHLRFPFPRFSALLHWCNPYSSPSFVCIPFLSVVGRSQARVVPQAPQPCKE